MKLICEVTEDIRYLKEESEDGKKKNYFIEGIFLQGDIKNRNGRVYPSKILEKEVDRYIKESVEQRRAYGELNHPNGPTINLDRVSHMITELRKDGSNFIGKAKIMETPMGSIVKNLIEEGANLGVSSRGMGSLRKNSRGIMEVQEDFMLSTAGDIVADPSAPNAFVNGIMEGVNWVYDAASGKWIVDNQNAYDEIAEEVKKTGNRSTRELEENAVRLFEKFMNSLSK